nr:adenylate/guanylate cyclase domain-containing protein [Ktedonobacteraceae bacterium]
MRPLPTGTLTLLFTDIEGSTRLLQRLGSGYADLLRECRSLLRKAFQQRNGHEVDTQGDAFFVVFERAADAISAAAAAQQALFNAHWPAGARVRVRMGLHTGEPQATEEGYIGLDVHRAARIMSAAHGGQVLLSQATYDLVASDLPEGVCLQDLGEYRLKDIVGQSRLFHLLIPGVPADFPPLSTLRSQLPRLTIPSQSTSFVGREQECVAVCEHLRRTDVRLLTLIGTAGVGKTRLALQVATALTDLFADGICFVALERVSHPDEVLPTMAQALDVQEEKDIPLMEQVKANVRGRSILLV